MSYVVVEREGHSVNVAGPNPASGNTGGLGIYNGEMRVSSLEGRTTALESSTKSVAERVAAGEMNGMAGLDNGSTPPLPGVVLSAQIAAAIAAGWPENRIFWVSLGTESGTGSGNLGSLSFSATSALFLGTLVGYSSGNLGTLAFTGASALALGALAGVIVSAGSSNLGSLSFTADSALSLGTLAGVQIGNTGNLSLTGTSALALGSLAGVTGAVNGNMESLALTGTSTLALGTLAGVAALGAAYDLFTGTDGTTAQSHTGDLNATWAKMLSCGAGNAVISGNTIASGTDDVFLNYYNPSYTPPTANYYVEASFTSRESMADLDQASIFVHASASQDTYYSAQFYNGGFYIVKKVNGGTLITLPGSYGFTWGAGVTKTLRLSIVNNVLRLYVDGVLRITADDSASSPITAIGFGGFGMYGATTTSCKIDNWALGNL